MKRISSHYGVLGVELMLERCPKLREHMEEDYDEGLIHEVSISTSQPHTPVHRDAPCSRWLVQCPKHGQTTPSTFGMI